MPSGVAAGSTVGREDGKVSGGGPWKTPQPLLSSSQKIMESPRVRCRPVASVQWELHLLAVTRPDPLLPGRLPGCAFSHRHHRGRVSRPPLPPGLHVRRPAPQPPQVGPGDCPHPEISQQGQE